MAKKDKKINTVASSCSTPSSRNSLHPHGLSQDKLLSLISASIPVSLLVIGKLKRKDFINKLSSDILSII